MNQHPYMERYRNVWEATLAAGELTEEQIEKSRYYFEADIGTPKPKKFDTYGIVSLMPMPLSAQEILNHLWDDTLNLLGRPLAYAVEPQNRHVELILFSRPEEIFDYSTTHKSIETSFAALKSNPSKLFRAAFNYPFITPDGTVVVPGFPDPASAIDDFRRSVRVAVGDSIPKQQSQWFHISLGRILEPVNAEAMRLCLKAMKDRWGEQLFTLDVSKAIWTHEKRWYMLDKDILHVQQLK